MVRRGKIQPYVSTWNGLSWTDGEVAVSLNTGDSLLNLPSVAAISCTSPNFCMAGGNYIDRSGKSQPFISSMIGTHWVDNSVATALNIGKSFSALPRVNSISCRSPTFCVAGGIYVDAAGSQQSFASVWDGAQWTDQGISVAPNSSTAESLAAVACTFTYFCAAGGSYSEVGGFMQAFAGTLSFASQVPLKITVPGRGKAGSPIIFKTSGGSGLVAINYAVTGKHCSLRGDRLSADSATNCVLTASNLANGDYATVTAPSVVIHFSLISQRALRVDVVRRADFGKVVTLRVTGGSGSGKVTFHTFGIGCILRARFILANRVTRCRVEALKRGFGKFRPTTSPSVVVTFVKS